LGSVVICFSDDILELQFLWAVGTTIYACIACIEIFHSAQSVIRLYHIFKVEC